MYIYPRVYYIHVDTTTNPRQQRGKEIANKHDQIKRIDEFTYKVRSQTTNNLYDIIKTELGWVCNCPDHTFRKVCCKHIHACEFSLKIREQVKNEITIEPIEISSCPRCTSQNIVRHGIRHNKSGNIQRYSCLDCCKWFSFNIGFERMKSNPQAITSALQLYFTGESLRNVQKFLRLQRVEVSHQTIYNWISKYTNLMEKYLGKITPQVSDKWRADEIYTKVKGNPKYLFALMDDETRFLIAKEMSDKKHGFDARNLFAKGREVTGKKPKVLVTDGLYSFKVAFRKEYYTMKAPRSVHVRNITLKGEKNNNKMERLNGEFRDREKVVRGLKKIDSPLVAGYQIYHNYIRSHMGLDERTPAELCGIKIHGHNKWKTLIQNSSNMELY